MVGTLRYLALLAILLHPDPPPVVAIEEPELGLHPDVIPQVAELLVRASERMQLFVTTHSRMLVDALGEQPSSVVVCEQENGESRFRRLDADALPEFEARYIGHLDGLLYGDDPEQGFVIGRRFAHPVMRIGFQAPPSITSSDFRRPPFGATDLSKVYFRPATCGNLPLPSSISVAFLRFATASSATTSTGTWRTRSRAARTTWRPRSSSTWRRAASTT